MTATAWRSAEAWPLPVVTGVVAPRGVQVGGAVVVVVEAGAVVVGGTELVTAVDATELLDVDGGDDFLSLPLLHAPSITSAQTAQSA